MARRDTLLTANAATKQLADDSQLTSFGFSTDDLAAYFGISAREATSLHRVVAGRPTVEDAALLRTWQSEKYSTPEANSGADNRLGAMEWGLNHLSLHPKGSRTKGDFNFSMDNPIVRGLAAFASGGYSEYARAGASGVEHAKQGKVGSVIGDVVTAGVSGATGVQTSVSGTEIAGKELLPKPPEVPKGPAVQPLSSPESSLAISPRRRKPTQTLLTGANGLPDDINTNKPTLLGGGFKQLGR